MYISNTQFVFIHECDHHQEQSAESLDEQLGMCLPPLCQSGSETACQSSTEVLNSATNTPSRSSSICPTLFSLLTPYSTSCLTLRRSSLFSLIDSLWPPLKHPLECHGNAASMPTVSSNHCRTHFSVYLCKPVQQQNCVQRLTARSKQTEFSEAKNKCFHS